MDIINILFKLEEGVRYSGGWRSSNGFISSGIRYSEVLLGPLCDKPLPDMHLQDSILMKVILIKAIKQHTYQKEPEDDIDKEQHIYWSGCCTEELNENFSKKYNIMFSDQCHSESECRIDLMELIDERIKDYSSIIKEAAHSWNDYENGILRELKVKEDEYNEMRKQTLQKIDKHNKYAFFSNRLKNLICSQNKDVFDPNECLDDILVCFYSPFEKHNCSLSIYPLDVPFSNKDELELEKFIKMGARKITSCVSDSVSFNVYYHALRNFIFSYSDENFNPNLPILSCYHKEKWPYENKPTQFFPLDIAFLKNDYEMIEKLIRLGARKYSSSAICYNTSNLNLAIKNYLKEADLNSIGLNNPIIESEHSSIYPLDFAIRSHDEEYVDFLLKNGACKFSNLHGFDLMDDFFLDKFYVLILYLFAEMDFLNANQSSLPKPIYDVTRDEIFAVLDEIYFLREDGVIDVASMKSDNKVFGYDFTVKQSENLKKVLADILQTFTWDVSNKYQLDHSYKEFGFKFNRAFPNYDYMLKKFY